MNEEKKTGFTQIQKFSDYFHIRTKKTASARLYIKD